MQKLKRCNDAYGFGCDNHVYYNSVDQLSDVFRLMKTFTGSYYRNVCKQCEARKKMDQRKSAKYKKTKQYDWWDYGERF